MFQHPQHNFDRKLYSSVKRRVCKQQKRTGTWKREQKEPGHKEIYVIGIQGKAINEHGDIVGVKRVGKDTAAQLMNIQSPVDVQCKTIHFAGPLKSTFASNYELDRAFYDRNDMKELPIGQLEDWSWRKILEIGGTDLARVGVGEKIGTSTDAVWSKKVLYSILKETLSSRERMAADIYGLSDYDLFERDESESVVGLGVGRKQLFQAFVDTMLEKKMPAPLDFDTKVIFVPDTRFYNEYNMIKSLHLRDTKIKGYIVQVVRTLQGKKKPKNPHPSDTVDDRMKPDFVIENNGSMDDLQHECRKVMKQILK